MAQKAQSKHLQNDQTREGTPETVTSNEENQPHDGMGQRRFTLAPLTFGKL